MTYSLLAADGVVNIHDPAPPPSLSAQHSCLYALLHMHSTLRLIHVGNHARNHAKEFFIFMRMRTIFKTGILLLCTCMDTQMRMLSLGQLNCESVEFVWLLLLVGMPLSLCLSPSILGCWVVSVQWQRQP